MSPIKTFLTVSALATVANAVSATTWDVAMNAQNYVAGLNGDLVFENFVGTWDDVTGLGSWSGHLFSQESSLTASFGVVPIDISYTQTFFMPTTPGIDQYGDAAQGRLNAFDIPTCVDHLNATACTELSNAYVVAGDYFFNTTGTSLSDNRNNLSLAIPYALTPTDGGVYTWTTQYYRYEPFGIPFFIPTPMTVTLSAQAPIPATAWLFGWGLVGLMGTAARRRKSLAAGQLNKLHIG